MKYHYHYDHYQCDRYGSESCRKLCWHCPFITTPFAVESIEYSITMTAINREIIATQ